MNKKRKKTVSLTDIAKLSGFSVATVSKVLNNTQGSAVKAEKSNLILEIAGQLNYRPNRIAQFFESGKTGQIAYVLPYNFFTNYSTRASFSLIMEVYAGAVEYFAQHKYMTNLLFSPKEGVQDFLRSTLLAQHNVDGVILYAGEQELAMTPEFEAMGIPVVSFDWKSPRFHVSHVEESPVLGVEQAVKYLKQLNHVSVGCFYFYDNIRSHHAVLRSDCFVNCCQENGIEVMKDYTSNYSDETDSYLKTYKLFLQKGARPTAMFYPSDHAAMMGLRALMDLNIKVPEEVSIIGFDNAPFNINSKVPLATINVPRKVKGANGAKLLLERISLPEKKETKTITLHTDFMDGASIGPAINKIANSA